MNPKLIYTCAFLLLTSCIAGIDREGTICMNENAEISVEQAREFFEQEMLTRNDDTPSPNVLSPGDFTPRWDDARVSQNYRIACVDVPIIPTYRYRAIRSEFQLGQAKAYVVDVSQKVVVVKDRETGVTASYVMSLIPDKDFAAKHKGDISDLFLNANGREKFSGILLYTHHGCPTRFSKYIDGKRVEGISICGVSDNKRRKEILSQIGNNLSGIKILKSSGIASRTGEDGYEPDPDESDDLATIGGGSEGDSGNNSGGNSGDDTIYGGDIGDVIVIGSGSKDEENDGNENIKDDDNTTDVPQNPQPDPEDPSKDPLENPDDEENIYNDGNDDYDERIKEDLNEYLDRLQKILSNSLLKQYILDNRLPFIKNNRQKTFGTQIQRDKQTGEIKSILGIEYNETFFLSLSEEGILLVLLHEYIHAYLAINGLDFSHDAMIDDAMYLEGIKDIFPDGSDFFYDAMKYAGCYNAEDFNDLSDNQQEIIIDIIDRKIYK